MSAPLYSIGGVIPYEPLRGRWHWYTQTDRRSWWRRLAQWADDLIRVVWRADSWAPAWGIDWTPLIVWTVDDDYFAKRDEIIAALRKWNREPTIIVPAGVRVNIISVSPPMLQIWIGE